MGKRKKSIEREGRKKGEHKPIFQHQHFFFFLNVPFLFYASWKEDDGRVIKEVTFVIAKILIRGL